uniref:Uncharacterized protein n=1 Tax=Caenorhabditis japonica TaxID=281687 RepID=A0A8R1EX24_CAEJA
MRTDGDGDGLWKKKKKKKKKKKTSLSEFLLQQSMTHSFTSPPPNITLCKTYHSHPSVYPSIHPSIGSHRIGSPCVRHKS